MEDKLKQYISNIEQLGADARYEYNNYNYINLKKKLESIINWCNVAIVLINRIERRILNNGK